MRFTRVFYFLLISSIVSVTVSSQQALDDEFSEFDDDDSTIKVNEEPPKEQPVANKIVEDTFDTDDGIVEDEFDDTEEFEGFAGTESAEEKNFNAKKQPEPKLNIVNKVPYSRVLWYNYWIELLFIGGLVVYFINYTMGKNKNIKIANSWLAAHRSFLEDNFALVGDDTKKDESIFINESDSIFSLWCSGRALVEGMLVELKLIKRQDLLSVTLGHLLFGKKVVFSQLIKSATNYIIFHL